VAGVLGAKNDLSSFVGTGIKNWNIGIGKNKT
jgi:hypothetical protein